MKKRGQMYNDIFRYFLIAFIVIMVIIFGVDSLQRVRSSSCKTELVLFKEKLKKSVEEIYSQTGSIKDEGFSVPCNIENIYFVDLGKDMDALYSSLYMLPIVIEEIKANLTKNTFLIKNKRVIDSLYIGDIDLNKPYFVCSDTSQGKLGLYLSGKGFSTEVANKECGYDCTFEVTYVDRNIAEDILNKAVNFGCNGCPTGYNFNELVNNFIKTNQSVKIARRCNCGREEGTTVVEILIKPEKSLKNFKLIEEIPKEYINDLGDSLENMSGDYDYYRMLSDPLMVWHFNQLSEDTLIRYVLNTDVSKYCEELLKPVATVVTRESEGPDVNLEQPEDNPLKLDLPNDIIKIKIGTNNVFNKPIWKFASDADVHANALKNYKYLISINSAGPFSNTAGNLNSVQCEIAQDKHVRCNTASTPVINTQTFYIEADDGKSKATDSFTVQISSCENGEVKDCPKQYGVCSGSRQVCANNQWTECNYLTIPNYEETETKCDGLDNNCDGNIDKSLTIPCGSGICAGTKTCTDGIWNNCNTKGIDCGICCKCENNNNPNPIYDASQNSDCSATDCSSYSSGCNKGNCGEYIYGIYNISIPNQCSGLQTCTNKQCTATCEEDRDRDGYSTMCGDCNELRNDVYSRRDEICNDNLDNNCNTLTDCNDNVCIGKTNSEGKKCCSASVDCNDNNECSEDRCESNKCVNDPMPKNNKPCDNNKGKCKDGNCIANCELNNAYWSTDKAIEGDIVTLTVEGTNCNNKTVSFEIKENDITGDDDVEINPSPAVFSNNKVLTTWTAEWQKDGLIGNPEYFFRARVNDKEIKSLSNLKVLPKCSDNDKDNYGAKGTDLRTCSNTVEDCNDNNTNINPKAVEVCDGVDNNCDGKIDEGVKNTYYRDSDGDGYGNAAISQQSCTQPSGYVTDKTDCEDSKANIYPGASEKCNNLDDNCNTQIDELWADKGKACGNCGTYTCKADGSNIECTGQGVCSKDSIRDAGDYCSANKVYTKKEKCTSACQWNDESEPDVLVQDCNLQDNWYNTTETKWIDETVCKEKEQRKQEYRDYGCSAGSCTYPTPTRTQWIDTGNKRNKADGSSCGVNMVCKNGDCVNAVASLTATITKTRQYVQSGKNYQDYDLVIKESNGIGVDITKGRECFYSVGCRSWVSFSPPRRVPANGQYTRSSYWYTPYSYDEYWLEYQGRDDNGNDVSVSTNKLIHPS